MGRQENVRADHAALAGVVAVFAVILAIQSVSYTHLLLCELATHKDFIKFLADIEIYVDGIATMQIQNLNALVDRCRLGTLY